PPDAEANLILSLRSAVPRHSAPFRAIPRRSAPFQDPPHPRLDEAPPRRCVHADFQSADFRRKMGYDLPPWKEPAPLNNLVKVLIVDDEASQRSGLAAMVSAWGMTPETASDGNEALLKLNDFEADVILTDLNMPG